MAQHLRIIGVVQGVGYRAAFARKAEQLKLRGWVRNRVDGSVEAIISGAVDALGQMIDWARHGPPGAQVTAVSITEVADAAVAAERLANQVEIRPTE